MKYYGIRFLLFCCVLCLVSSPEEDGCAQSPCAFKENPSPSLNTTCAGTILIENLINRDVDAILESQGNFQIKTGNIMLMAYVELDGKCPRPIKVQWGWQADHIFNGKRTPISLQAFTPTTNSYITFDKIFVLNMIVYLSATAIVNTGSQKLTLTKQVIVTSVHPNRQPVFEGGNSKLASLDSLFKLDASPSYDPINMTLPSNITYFYFCQIISLGDDTETTVATTPQQRQQRHAEAPEKMKMPRGLVENSAKGLTTFGRTSNIALPADRRPSTRSKSLISKVLLSKTSDTGESSRLGEITRINGSFDERKRSLVERQLEDNTAKLEGKSGNDTIIYLDQQNCSMPPAAFTHFYTSTAFATLNVTNVGSTVYMFGLITSHHYDVIPDLAMSIFPENYFQTVHFKHGNYPIISARCVYNCFVGNIQGADKIIIEAFGISQPISELEMVWSCIIQGHEEAKDPVNWSIESVNEKSNPRLHLRPGAIDYGTPVNFRLNLAHAPATDPSLMQLSFQVQYSIYRQTDLKCEIYPNTGYALLTNFTVVCNTAAIQYIQYIEYYQRISETDKILLRYTTSLTATNLRLTAGNFLAGYSSTVEVQVFDKIFDKYDFKIANITVKPLRNSGNCKANYFECLHDIVGENDELTLTDIAASGNDQSAVQIAHVIATIVNDDENQDDTSLYEKMMIMEQLALFVNTTPMVTFSSIVQVTLCLAEIVSNEKMPISLKTEDVAMEIIFNSALNLGRLINFDAVPDQPKHYMAITLSELILDCLENVFDVLFRQSAEGYIQQNYNFYKKFKTPTMNYQSYRAQLNKTLINMSQSYFKRLEQLFALLRTALFVPDISDGEHISVASSSLFMLHFYRNNYDKLASMNFDIQDRYSFPLRPYIGFIQFPNSAGLSGVRVDLEAVTFGRNPMAGYQGTISYGIPPVSIKVTNVDTGELITDFGSPVELYLRPPVPPEWKESVGIAVKQSDQLTDEDVHIFQTFVSLSEGNKRLVTYVEAINTEDQLTVLTVLDHRPHLSDFNQNITLDRLPAEFNGTSTSVYVGVLPTNYTATRILEEAGNVTSAPVLVYSVSLRVLQCVHWDDTSNTWSEDKCQAVEQSQDDPYSLHCSCDSLSIISGVAEPLHLTQKIVSPFDFYLLVPTCYIIVFLEVCLLLIYIILVLLVVCCRRRFVSNDLLTTVIKDNDPYYRNGYLVSVTTSNATGSGSNAKLAIRIFGKELTSSVHVLTDKSRKILRTGAVDHFLILTKDSMGPLTHLTFTAFSEEEKPSPWFMQSIEIHELSTMNRWYFDFKDSSSSYVTVDDRNIQNHTLKETTPHTADVQQSRCSGSALYRRFRTEYFWVDWTSVSSLTLLLLVCLLALFLNLCLRGLPTTNPAEHIGRYGFSIIFSDIGLMLVAALILMVVIVLVVFLRDCFFEERRLFVIIDLDELEQRDVEDSKFTPISESSSVVTEPEKPEEPIEPEKVKSPSSELTVYRINVGRPDEGIYDLSVKPLLKPKPTPEIEGAQGDVKEDLGEEEGVNEMETVETKEATTDFKGDGHSHMAIRVGLLILWIIIIIILAFLNIFFGLRLSHTCAHIWLFCSLLTVLVCALLFHPLVILVKVLICPQSAEKVQKDQIRWLAADLDHVLALRNQRINALGGPNEYRTYLKDLRRRIQYNTIPFSIPADKEPNATDK